ncbi:MAG: hypothetical protein R3B09_01780 [Nannocystaceae bacterium]
MLENALDSDIMRPSARFARCCSAALALALAVPASARAASAGERDAATLQEQAARSEGAIDEAGDEDQRMLAYFRAIDGWLRAFAVDGELASSCAARAILTRALDDERLDVRVREELRERFDARAASERECEAREREGQRQPTRSTTVPLLDPGGPLDQQFAEPTDGPRRSPRTIAGATLLALAAPAVGGLVFAALTDVAVAREVRERQTKLETSGERNDARIAELEVEAKRALGLEIGLGIGTAALVGAGVALLATRHRARGPRPLSIAPNAGASFGGVVLSGRF